ncbi:MAG: lipoate--protein ligase family protein [Candidatus Cloacimonetes bacterium]|nr:lipoate--protein ligase family protein [Candidatus Cloacimonadota bacterium]
MEWRVLVSGKMSPYMNMALDEAIYLSIIKRESLPTLRFYDWEPASFSCGFNQNIDLELDFERLKTSQYGFVRRPTGGRMVLHEEEVTYAVISPLEGAMAGSISDTYFRIGKALLTGLKIMNVEAELSKGELSQHEQRQPANPCFTSSSRFELTYKRKKLVGSAQTRNNTAFLQHGSILKTYNQKKVADFIPNINEDERLRIASLLERRTISLQMILERDLTFNEVVNNLISGFKEAWPEDTFYLHETPTLVEKNTAEQLMHKKYATDQWNKKERKTQKEFDTYLSMKRI